jgi:hypothetical protein
LYPFRGQWGDGDGTFVLRRMEPFASIPIGTIATSWTDEGSGETFVLLFPESIYFGDRLPHSLLCPNQMRAHGVQVNDMPRQFDGSSTHSIEADGYCIPLHLDGVTVVALLLRRIQVGTLRIPPLPSTRRLFVIEWIQ